MADTNGAYDATRVPQSGPGLQGGRLPDGSRVAGRYEVARFLAQGGMGAVYVATDTAVARTVAFKVIPRSAAEDPVAHARFQREIRAAGQLAHPNIVRLFDVGEERDFWFYTMEFVDGPSLARVLKDVRRLPARTSMRVAAQVARALAHAHAAGIVHRDVKPGNILLVAEGPATRNAPTVSALQMGAGFVEEYRAVLTDFGLARDVRDASQLTMTGDVIGTPFYMSPEQAAGRAGAIDGRTDVWGLGAVLYEMLTGVPPFTGESLMEVLERVKTKDPVPPRKLVPELSVDAETIVLKTLEKDPARRYATAQELADDVERYLRGEAIQARPAGRLYRWRKAAARRPALSAAVAVALFAALAFGAWFLGPRTLDVRCGTPGARVSINGRDRGPANASLRVWIPGEIEVRLACPGFEAEERKLSVRPWGSTSIKRPALRPDRGEVAVDVFPEEAHVELVRDGARAAGRGGRSLFTLPNGTWQITVSAPGYRPATTGFTVAPEAPINLPVRLEREFGWVTVEMDGMGATMWAWPSREEPDPVPRPCRLGEAPPGEPAAQIQLPADRARLDAGAYALMFTRPGYFPRRCTARVEAAEERRALEIQEGGWTRPVAAKGHLRFRLSLEPMLLWTAAAGRVLGSLGHSGACALADLNGDGVPDAVQVSTDRRVRALSGIDGTPLWTFETGGPILVEPGMGDLNRDGAPDVLVTSDDGIFYALSGRSGRALWTYSMPQWCRTTAAAADLDGDGAIECVLFGSDTRIHVFRGIDGAELWSKALPGGTIGPPALSDFDGDGVVDAAGGGANVVVAWSGRDGRELWRADARMTFPSPMLARVGTDRRPGIVVAGERVVALSGAAGKVLWSSNQGPALGCSAPADFNGDGADDVAVSIGGDRLCAISGADGADLWSASVAGGLLHSPATGDCDGDGRPDLAVGTADGKVLFLSGATGRALAEFPLGSVPGAPALADLDGDGRPECVVATRDARLFAVRTSPGPVLWRNAHPAGGASPVGVADLDGDGVPDGVYTAETRLRAVSGADGRLLWSVAGVGPPPILSDVDRDGRPDAVSVLDHVLVALRAGDGKRIWTGSAFPSDVCSLRSVADLNGDGVADILTAAMDGAVTLASGADGAELWSFRTASPVYAAPVPVDLDGDGAREILVASSDFHAYAIAASDGRLLWKYRTGNWVGGFAVADANGDRVLDAFFGAMDGAFYAVDGRSGALLWRFAGEQDPGMVAPHPFLCPQPADLDRDGRPEMLVVCSDRRAYGVRATDGSILWTFSAGGVLRPGPGLEDLDGDGSPDLLAGSADGRVYALAARDGALLWRFAAGDAVDAVGDVEFAGGKPETVWISTRTSLLRGRLPRPRPAEKLCDALEVRRWLAHGAWQAIAQLADPADPAQLVPLARALLALGRAPEAGAHLERAAAAFPGDPVCRILLAAATGEPAPLEDALALDAETAFGAAADARVLDALRAPASRARAAADTPAAAVAHLLAGRWPEARAALAPLLAAGRRPELLRLRAHAAAGAGDPQAALDDWTTLDRLGIRFPEQRACAEAARGLLGDPRKKALELAQGREYEASFPWFEKALDRWPDDLGLNNAYAWHVATWKWPSTKVPGEPAPDARTARAVAAARRAVQLAGDAADAWQYVDTLAAAHFANAEIREAIAAQEKALSLAPEADREEIRGRLEAYRKRLSGGD